MVLPAPAPHDAPGPDERPWLERLSGILRLVRRGVLVLVDLARPERLGELVRSLWPHHPDVEVYTNVVDLARAEPGALAVLVPDPRQAGWLNQERPLFANRALRVILFSDAETSGVLARRAPDFFNWISHRLECPEGVSLPAVRGIRAALETRAPGLVWRGGDFEAAFRTALPGRPLRIVSAAMPYSEMVDVLRERGRGWVAWTDVDGPFRMRRVRWAAAEAGRRGRVALIEPGVEAPGFVPVDGRLLGVAEARERLAQAGAKRPGRLAALVELEAEAIEMAGALLRAGEAETGLVEALRVAADPGVALGTVARQASVPVPVGIAGRTGRGANVAPDAVELFLRSPTFDEDRCVDAITAAVEWKDDEVATRLARAASMPAGGELTADAASEDLPLELIASALAIRGEYQKAEQLLRRALTREEALPGAERPDQAPILFLLGRLLTRRGSYQEAEQLLRRCLAIHESGLGVDSPDSAAVLLALGNVLMNQAQYEEAEQLLRRSLGILEKALGTRHPLYRSSLPTLAKVLEERGKYEEAEQLLRRSLDEMPSDEERPSYVASLQSLGVVLGKQGKYAEAEQLLRRALALDEKSFGADPRQEGSLEHALAVVLWSQGKYEEAEQLLRRSLTLRERTLGVHHPNYATSLQLIGNVLEAQGKYAEAEQILRHALALEEESLGVVHPFLSPTLTALGMVLARQGRAGGGLPFLERALRLAVAARGAQHPDVGQIVANLVKLPDLTRHAEAAAMARRVLDLLQDMLGHEHPSVVRAAPRLLAISTGTGAAGANDNPSS